MLGAGYGVRDVAGVAGEALALVRHFPEQLPQIAVARHRGGLRPLHLELGRGLDDVLLDRADDADEVALADDADALDLLDRALVDRECPYRLRVRPLATRTNH